MPRVLHIDPKQFMRWYMMCADVGQFFGHHVHGDKSGYDVDIHRPLEALLHLKDLCTEVVSTPFLIVVWRFAISNVVAVVMA